MVRSLEVHPADLLRAYPPTMPNFCRNYNPPQSHFETNKSQFSAKKPAQLPLWDWKQSDRPTPSFKIRRVPENTRLGADRWVIAVCDGAAEFALPIQLTAKEAARFITHPPKLDLSLDADRFPIEQRSIEAALEKLIDGGAAR
jgi:hypothetical protein